MLRAVAAGLVVLVHAIHTYASKVAPIADAELRYDLANFGVKLFFCISGYIIAKAASNLSPGWSSASYFARRRLIRIVPLYWCATLIYAAKLSLQGDMPTGMDVLRSLLFVPYTDAIGLMRPVLGQGWTLNFEMLFYATLCLSLALDRSLRFPAVAAVFLSATAARLLGWVPLPSPGGETAWELMADPVLLFFLGGMLVGAARGSLSQSRLLPKTFAGAQLLSLVLLAAFLVPASRYGLDFVGGAGSIGAIALELAVSTTLVYLSVRPYPSRAGEHGRGLLQRSIVAAGDGSYSTYLIHGFVMGPAARIMGALHLHVPYWLFAVAMVFVCSAVGVLVYRLFELPLQTKMNARWGRHSGQ